MVDDARAVEAPTAAADRAEPADPEDRQQAIADILAEIDDEVGEEAGREADADGDNQLDSSITDILAEVEDGREAEAPPAPQADGQDEEAPAAAPSASTPPPLPPAQPQQAPRQSRQPSLPRVSTPHAVVVLHALLLLVFAVGTWLSFRQVARALAHVSGGRPAEPALHSPGTPTPPPGPKGGESLLRVDEGLRYVQETEKADVLFEKEDYGAAAAAYRRALELMPKNWNDGAAAFRLGECRFRLGDYPQAIAAYEQVALAYPSDFHPRALFQLGEAHLRLGAYSKAREAFYALLLRQGRYGPAIAPYIEKAYYRVADCHWLEADSVAGSAKGAGE